MVFVTKNLLIKSILIINHSKTKILKLIKFQSFFNCFMLIFLFLCNTVMNPSWVKIIICELWAINALKYLIVYLLCFLCSQSYLVVMKFMRVEFLIFYDQNSREDHERVPLIPIWTGDHKKSILALEAKVGCNALKFRLRYCPVLSVSGCVHP